MHLRELKLGLSANALRQAGIANKVSKRLPIFQLTVSQGNVVSRVHIYVCLQLGGVLLLMEEYVLPLRLILREDFALRVIPDVASIDKTTNV